MERRKIRDEDDARSCLAAAERSGLERAEWARGQGVDARSLNCWRVAITRNARRNSPIRLVELVATPAAVVPYRIHVGRFEVEIDRSFEDDVLTRLLRVVASC